MNDYYFVSYSTKDSKVAHQMVEYLEEKGVKCKNLGLTTRDFL